VSKNLVFSVFGGIVIVGIIGLAYIAVERPDATATFAGIIVTFLATVSSFAITVYGLGRLNEKVDVAVRQTNGNLSAKENENKRLLRLLEENGINAHESK
jgi:hypothetical protein